MPIIVLNNSTQSNQAVQTAVANVQPVVATKPANVPVYPNHNTVMVNGKPKKMGKRSQYLLDMLTTEE